MSVSGKIYKRNEPGVGGRIFLTIWGLFFAGIPLVMVGLILKEAANGLSTWTWPETPCTITAGAVVRQNTGGRGSGDFAFEVKYRYVVDGKEHASQQCKLSPATSENYRDMALLTERFPIGAKTICYVNPKAPNEAVLIRYNLLTPLVILFPLVFVAIGVSVVYWGWKKQSRDPGAVSSRAMPANGRRIGTAFFSFFLLIGGVTFYVFFLRPATEVVLAKSWPDVPCVVESSGVQGHSGSKGGTTYSVNILYSYTFDGAPHKSNAYDFMGGSSSGYTGKQAIVSQYRPGTRAVCYVNPNDPTEAVLMRGFSSTMWIGLLPLVFIGIGAVGIVSILRKSRGTPLPSNTAVTYGVAGNLTPDTLVLKPTVAPWPLFIAAIFVCCFWNGIVSIFLYQVYSGWNSGHPQWFLMIFLTPFVGIGLVMLGSGFYYFLALFDPRPHLTITPGAGALGDSLHVKWTLAGNVSRLKNLRFQLAGREEARVGQGKGSHTDTSYFANLEIANITLQREMQNGEARVTIPPNFVPSFTARNNKIIWSIHVRGEIPRWPDLNQEFPITILPGKPAVPQSI